MLGYRNLVCGCVPHAWGAFAPAKGSLNNMKAIIPAAGLGTRFLPGTKCTPKEMLPVLDKPVIQYVVEEALDPEEVDDAIIVTSPGKPELLNYFQPDRSLENLLRERGKLLRAEGGLLLDGWGGLLLGRGFFRRRQKGNKTDEQAQRKRNQGFGGHGKVIS